ncbi:deoxynucleoside triphosphate triphosphohydrolase SAMHD1-like [Ptychodera flava]|uniref:deoxynucleoside triphosphate triphosphohydrolase SAMHD1-like n=1 Tax=Ptychodera flava TaxID=63121 RepID=UPI00396A3DDF
MADSPSSTESNPRTLSQDDSGACSGSQGYEQSSQGDAQRIVTTTFDQGNHHTRGQSMYQPSKEITKVFQDPIHGTIELNHVYMKIIDTPEFQRLRNVKQLGTVNFVYAGAVHTRFEHSIGTCYLALRLIRYLKERQKNLGITDEEELCVGLAALCHDLGHGPFSHMFDSLFIPKFKPENYENWSHELGAVKIFDDMVKKYDLKSTFERLGYNLEEFHYHMIKEMIYGPLEMNGDEHYKPSPAIPKPH